MLESLTKMVAACKTASEYIMKSDGVICNVSHYDADGICSASIIASALSRANKRFHLTFVKQLTKETLEELAKTEYKLFIFSDLGSGYTKMISNALKEKVVVILDHHQPDCYENFDNIHHINPLLFGITEDVSGSGVSYIMARALDEENKDLSELAVVGAVGDSQVGSIGNEWGLVGLNREILKDAESSGMVETRKGIRIFGRNGKPLHKALQYSTDPFIPGIYGSESGAITFLKELGIEVMKEDGSFKTLSDLSEEEQRKLASGIIKERIRGNVSNVEDIFGNIYILKKRRAEFSDASEFATFLNSCGKMGRPSLGVKLCMNIESAYEEIKDIFERYKKGISEGVRWVREEIERGKNVMIMNGVYIMAQDKISDDLISNVVSIISNSSMFNMPIFGFSNSENGYVKVSARIPRGLNTEINLKEIMEAVSGKLGGYGGGHKRAAGALVKGDRVDEFIEMVEEILKNKKEDDKKKDIEVKSHEKIEHGKKKMERKGLVRYLSAKGI